MRKIYVKINISVNTKWHPYFFYLEIISKILCFLAKIGLKQGKQMEEKESKKFHETIFRVNKDKNAKWKVRV